MGVLATFKSLLRPPPPPPVALETVSSEQLGQSLAAGLRLREAAAGLAAGGRTALDAVLNGNAFVKWQMYPWQGGILDQRTNSQYFYHSHEDYRGEHGHFHTFLYHQRKLVHLVALGLDARGRINQLYTFNRWGPGDHYFPAATLKTLLPRFRMRLENDLDPRLHQFVGEALVLFRAEIEHLFDERDANFAAYRARNNGASPYEDRALEITSAVPADVETEIARIQAELERRVAAGAALPGVRATAAESPSGDPTAEPPTPEPRERPSVQLKRSLEAGLEAGRIAAALRGQGRGVLGATLNGKELEDWEMYPWDGGVVDKATRSQWFYHSHPQSPEHGHFHVFYHHRGQLVHLVAIAMDNQGEPITLFTVNRWVTDELYLPAHKVKSLLPQFRIENRTFDAEVNAYVRALLLLYQVEIETLLDLRDAAFEAYRATHNGASPFEDRELEVTSSLAVRMDEQIAVLEAELRRRGEA